MAAPDTPVTDGSTGPNTDALGDAHADMLSDRALQFEMPPFRPPEIPSWFEPLAQIIRAVAPLMVWVFWAGVAAAVCFFLYLIAREILRRLPDRKPSSETSQQSKPEYRPSPARARALLEEADRLAADGRYSEAARVLLHRSIEDLERASQITIGSDLTSREVATIDALSKEGRSVFTRIARAVEVSLFGGRTLNADDFFQCREAYASFALSGARR